jgi:hypothetical protein
MPQKISRREVTKRGLLGAAALAMPTLTTAQEKKQEPPDPAIDQELAMIEKQLAKPLSEEARKLTRATIKNSSDAAKERLKTKLPENSEPCTIFVPYSREKKSL